MSKKTSITHPLQIAEVLTKEGGRIGLTFCPGKKQPSGLSGSWDRDLALDLDMIRAWGATAVVSLIESHEIAALGVESLGAVVRARGMAWYHLPISDGSVPSATFEDAYDRIYPEIHRRLAEGEAVLVHCKGGLGRAGLMTARLLIEDGDTPQVAIDRVRSVRPGAIENAEQERYLEVLAPSSEKLNRLRSLARYAPIFEQEEFSWGEWKSGPGLFPYFESGPDASTFVADAYENGWVKDFDWPTWMDSDEAVWLKSGAGAIEAANANQLFMLLTTCIRGDRFSEGALAESFEAGFLTRIARRAAELVAD